MKLLIRFIPIVFFIHFFTIESYRNKFIEYDQHFFVLLMALVVATLFCIAIGEKKIIIRIPYLVVCYNFLIIYALFQKFLDSRISSIGLYNMLAIGILFGTFQFLIFNSGITFLARSFAIIIILMVGLQLSETAIFPRLVYNENTLLIGQGFNSNFYSSVTPFLFYQCIICFEKRIKDKLAFLIFTTAFLASFSIVVIGGSRNGLVASVIGCFLTIGILKWKEMVIFFKCKKIAFIGVLIGSLIVISLAVVKLYFIRPDSILGRILIFKINLFAAKQNWLSGLGFGRYKSVYNNYQSNYFATHTVDIKEKLLASNNNFAFNEYINAFLEFGVVGIILILGMIFFIVKSIKRQFLNPVTTGAIGSIFSIMIACVASYPLHNIAVVCNLSFFLAILMTNKNERDSFLLKLTSIQKNVALSFLILVTFIFLAMEYKRFLALKDWEEGVYSHLTRHDKSWLVSYERAYPVLKTNGDFLFNYGAELSNDNQIQKSMNLLMAARDYSSFSSLYLYIAENFRVKNDIVNTIKYYKFTINMVPSKFVPKFRLLDFYLQHRMYKPALKLADIILHFPVKIPSSEVTDIKSKTAIIVQKIDHL